MNKFNLTIFFTAVFIILLLCVNGFYGNGSPDQILNSLKEKNNSLESSLARGRFSLVKSIVDDQSLIINKYAESSFPDVIYYQGNFYSVFIPGGSFFGLPFYLITKPFNLGVFGINLTSTFFTLTTAFLLILILKTLNINFKISLLATFILIFATNIFAYATNYNAHLISATFVCLGIYSFINIIKNHKRIQNLLIFGLSYGLGMLVDYPNAITLFPLGIIIIFHFINISNQNEKVVFNISFLPLLASLTFLIGILPLLIYVYAIFGTIFTTIEPHQIQGHLENGIGIYKLNPDPNFYKDKEILHTHLSLKPSLLPRGLFTNLISLQRGIFIFSPILLLSIFGLVPLYKRNKKIFWGLLLSFLVTLLTYSSYTDYAGGWAFGPRFLIATTPTLIIFLAFAIQRHFHNLIFIFSLIILTTISFVINTLGALTTRLLPSPIDGYGWGLNNSFLKSLDYLQTPNSPSFLYEIFFKHFLSSTEYLSIITALIATFFMIILIFVFHQEGHHEH